MTRASMIQLAVSLVLLMTLAQRSTARSLLQGSTCSGPIPQCADNRCYLQTVAGRMQNVCERCKPGYNTTDDGLNCVCLPGTWHSCVSGTCTCLTCDKGMFCPGGWRQAKNYAPEDQKGQRLSCEQATVVNATSSTNTTTIQKNGLITKSSGAKRPQDCVPMPGFYLASTGRNSQKAALCPNSTYSPGYGRIRQCLKCQSGTEEKPDAGYASDPATVTSPSQLRTNRTDVCQVGPGRYLVQNVVRDCPAGSFRTSWSQTIESSSRYCFTCPPGVTTNSTRATDQTACKVVAPGVSMNMSTLESAQLQALAGGNSLADNVVALCPYGTYFPGGVIDSTTNSTCVTCPFGTTTQFLGAASINDCQIPPGYYIKITNLADTTGTLTTCPGNVTGQGYYRSGWTSYTDITARDTNGTTACTACGAGILSAPTDIDELGGGNDTSKLVAGSSFSCYIEAGWGMVPAGVAADQTLQYTAVECSNNTYGVANRTYGLQSTPCKPCQRNLITLQPASTNYTQCVNPAGFGYSPGGATVCAPGTYTTQGSMQGCTACPAGRTTADNSTLQTAITDCYVMPGYGVYNGTNGTSPWDFTTPAAPAGKANLTVMPCPVGYYGEGGQLDSKCVQCNGTRTTQGEMSSSVDQCDRCPAGFEFTRGTGSCSACVAGKYQPGYLGNDASGSTANFGAGLSCLTCPTTLSVYISSKGTEKEFISTGTTYRTGAASRDECVPKTAQLGIDVGTKFFDIAASDSMLDSPSIAFNSFDTCIEAACSTDEQCCFVQFDYAYRKNGTGGPDKQTCRYKKMKTVSAATLSADLNLVYYKMLPSDAIAAASLGKVEAKAMSSGLYARCALPNGWEKPSAASGPYDTDKIGKRLLALSATNAAELAQCKRRCDMMSVCWGFTVKSGECMLRGGFDEMDVRSFFRNPPTSTGLGW